MKILKGWGERFKNQFGLHFRRNGGKAKSADTEAIANKMPCIRMLMISFDSCDAWNTDKFGLFYCQRPFWALSYKVASIRKEGKTQIIFLACCSADATDKCFY